MIKIIKAADRHFADWGWLQTYWLFSFDDYYDPQNVRFGALRVFNDDVIAPGQGFPLHPHREMEIVTVILEGEITHEDDAGHRGVVRAGDVQRMSAGTGVRHSEHNRGADPLHLYQIWILPHTEGLAPSYEQKSFAGAARENKLLAVASGRGEDGAVTMHADATVYTGELAAGRELAYPTAPERHLFVYVTAGALAVNDAALDVHDQGRIAGEEELRFAAREDASFVLIDVPA